MRTLIHKHRTLVGDTLVDVPGVRDECRISSQLYHSPSTDKHCIQMSSVDESFLHGTSIGVLNQSPFHISSHRYLGNRIHVAVCPGAL